MPIVATAGHVDHGKSTLVEALTGRDPDRWAEEKERGLTIDLGFAWTDLGGTAVSFVDVPGHERFIKNMLAGVGAVDCALLVVAADSGWMPQTEEHASVLDLLDVERGVIALTRIDLVDDDTMELAMLELAEEVAGTALAHWPIVPVSPVTGQGMATLRSALAAHLDPTPIHGPFAMWVDRVFTIKGAGLVVTGSVVSGEVETDDRIEALPDQTPARVRGLHRHDEQVRHIRSGERAALNLVSEAPDSISRGTLLATPGTVATSERFVASLRPTRAIGRIPRRGAFHLHLGSGAFPARVRALAETGAFLISTESPVPVTVGDRFILRETGRRAVVGGGRVLDPSPTGRPSVADVSLLTGALDASRDVQADALLTVRGIAETDDLAHATRGGTASKGIAAGSLRISEQHADELTSSIVDAVDAYHVRYPLRSGIGRAELATSLGIADRVVDAIIGRAETLLETDGMVASRSFAGDLDADAAASADRILDELNAGFDVPRMRSLDAEAELLHAMIRRGDLVQIADDLVFTSGQVDAIVAGVADMESGFTVADFRDHFTMTRRQAIPLLEWLDRKGITRRSGDGREVRITRPDEPGSGDAPTP